MEPTNFDDLATAMDSKRLATIRMHDGQLIEYAEIVGFPKAGEGASPVWVRPHPLLSGRRFTPRGNRRKLTIHSIASVELHQDQVPTTDSRQPTAD